MADDCVVCFNKTSRIMFLILWNFIYFSCHILSHVSGFPDLELLLVINHRPLISPSSSVCCYLWRRAVKKTMLALSPLCCSMENSCYFMLILHGLRCTQNYTVKSEVKTMDFLLSLFNLGKIIKEKIKGKKKNTLEPRIEVCYNFLSFLCSTSCVIMLL